MDIVGQRFGKQVVLKELGDNYVEIRCDCGTVKRSRKQYLLDGQSKSCGCGRYADIAKPINVGDVFERLTVVQKLGTNGHKREVLVMCSCGARKVVTEGGLRGGQDKSCGCFRRERASKLNFVHGQGAKRRTHLYSAWLAMRERVRNHERYPSYEGRAVFPEWEKSFDVFRDYVEKHLGERPKGFSLDRIENHLGYEPGNIKWSGSQQQMRNRRSNVFITIDGLTLCIADWAKKRGISPVVICQRRKKGWSDHDAVLTPVGSRKPREPKP